MIIFLKEGVELVADNENSEAIENIAFNCRLGNHVLLGSRSLLERISLEFQLTERTRAFLRQSAQRMTQQGNLMEKVSWAMVVDTSNSIAGDVPLRTFSNADYCEKAQLLTENLSDAGVLFGLASHAVSKKIKGFRVVLRQVAGGGSTIGQCLEGLTSSPSGATLCIVDSDRDFKGAALGGTAKGARDKHKKNKEKWRSEFYVIQQRELENIIPQELIMHCVNKHLPHAADQASALAETSTFFKDYFCLKSGDSMCRVASSIITKKQTSKLKEARRNLTTPLLDLESCGTCALDNSCKRSPGLGKGFLALAAQELAAGAVALDISDWRPELAAVVDRVVSFGLGASPLRV